MICRCVDGRWANDCEAGLFARCLADGEEIWQSRRRINKRKQTEMEVVFIEQEINK